MEFQIPLGTLFTQVFGIANAYIEDYQVKENNKSNPNLIYRSDKDIPNQLIQINDELEGDKAYFPFPSENKDGLQIVVKFPMAIKAGRYYVLNNGNRELLDFEGVVLPYTSIVSFTRAKRYTETHLSGQSGSIIEQYGWEPWDIRIQGFIINNNNKKKQSVTEQIKELQQYEEICDVIELEGQVFEMLKISHAAILSITYPDARHLNATKVRPFEMTLKSYEPFELQYHGKQ